MARFNAQQADNYGGQGGAGFFSLKNDKDTATVRFMYNTLDDVEGYAVHEVEVDGKKRYVNCLRDYNQPVEDCPLCAARQRVLAKLFVQVYDVETQEVKIWDRGKTFFSKISSLCNRYNPLVSTPFEIERNGKKGDTNTTYETYALETDDITLQDLPEAPQLLGGFILDKPYEELQFFIDNGYFEDADSEEEQTATRRPEARRSEVNNSQEMPVARRSAGSPRNVQANRRPVGSRPTGNRNTDKF